MTDAELMEEHENYKCCGNCLNYDYHKLLDTYVCLKTLKPKNPHARCEFHWTYDNIIDRDLIKYKENK